MRKTYMVAAILCLALCQQCFWPGVQTIWAKDHALKEVKKVRLLWEPALDAVGYELIVSKGAEEKPKNIIMRKTGIATPGYELDTAELDVSSDELFWRVRPVDFYQRPLGEFTEARPLKEGEFNPLEPMVTTQFDRFALAKMYPVFSWIPVLGADHYDLQVFFDDDGDPRTPDRLISIKTVSGAATFDYYEESAYREPGRYWWRVRADGRGGMPVSSWSKPSFFTVKADGGEIASFGDSITHGGGAISIPPSDPAYDWQSYTGLQIRNLGFSGNTVSAMVNRFNDDVLAFKPKILVIMGGINDLREGVKGAEVINGLNHIKYKCLFYDITPVFVTVLPVNPGAMKAVSNNPPAENWMQEQAVVNQWIKQQQYHVDIAEKMADRNGWLKSALSTDGLHPDSQGKKIIGEAVGTYLRGHFPEIAELAAVEK